MAWHSSTLVHLGFSPADFFGGGATPLTRALAGDGSVVKTIEEATTAAVENIVRLSIMAAAVAADAAASLLLLLFSSLLFVFETDPRTSNEGCCCLLLVTLVLVLWCLVIDTVENAPQHVAVDEIRRSDAGMEGLMANGIF